MPIQYDMPAGHFNSIIRQIKRGRLDQVEILRTATHMALKRLKAKRNLKQAVKGIPDGSDQMNFGSVIAWMKRIPTKRNEANAKAVDQVIVMDATCVARCNG